MPRMLLLVIGFALSGAVKKMLLGAGLGMVSYAFLSATFKWFLERVVFYMNADVGLQNTLHLLAIAQVDDALSLILSAISARVVINAMSLSVSKAT